MEFWQMFLEAMTLTSAEAKAFWKGLCACPHGRTRALSYTLSVLPADAYASFEALAFRYSPVWLATTIEHLVPEYAPRGLVNKVQNALVAECTKEGRWKLRPLEKVLGGKS